ncbi:MAG: hypothetical protein ACFNJI_00490 [Leptotrichia hongkongensis]
MKKIEQEAEENVIEIVMEIYFAKTEMEIVINKSLCEEVEFLRFCFFFILKKRKNYYYTKPRLNKKFITNFSNKE